MITADQARTLCYAQINRPDPSWPNKPEMVITEVEELPTAWVVYYTSSTYLASGSISDAIAGNGPLVMSKSTGRYAVAGTAPPLKLRIQEALGSLEDR